ncbi:S-layer homology domain-containing protein [Marinicrinis sediminis]|uniref:S-layer homology domain-containing protein n=1 Tax=Marinicrinis sediminis TaxID=1652465 RepID=A0ABW5R864_9BACL
MTRIYKKGLSILLLVIMAISTGLPGRAMAIDILPGPAEPLTIHHVAGTGFASYIGDGISAKSAGLANPFNMVIDGEDNLYIADQQNHRIRKLNYRTGIITTIAGTGTPGFSGDGGPAIQAQLNNPGNLQFDPQGNLYVVDSYNDRIRKIDANTGIIQTVAGSVTGWGFDGDGGPATEARMALPYAVDFAANGDMYIADGMNGRIRKVDAQTGNIETFAGGGSLVGTDADNGPAVEALLRGTYDVEVGPDGHIYIAEETGNQIRKVDVNTGIITTIAGTGVKMTSGTDGLAIDAAINRPWSVEFDAQGDLYVVERDGFMIRKIDMQSGYITHVAGTGVNGYSGDGNNAKDATFNYPTGVAFNSKGIMYVADKTNDVIRKIQPADISTPAVESLHFQTDGHAAMRNQVQIVMDEYVTPVAGTYLTIRKASDQSVHQQLELTDPRIVATGLIVTVTLDVPLEDGEVYYLDIDAQAFEDESGNLFLGITQWYEAPNKPVITAAEEADRQVTVRWNPVYGADRYQIYQSVTEATYGDAIATVTGSVYAYEASGLTNGSTYYYTVVASNQMGDSPYATQVSASPKAVPGAPTEVRANAAHRKATVYFTAPEDDGGRPITGYEVTASPGGLQATGTSSPIVVENLDVFQSYSFTVRAINEAGTGLASSPSQSVIPRDPAGSVNVPADERAEVLVNGKPIQAGKVKLENHSGRTTATLILDQQVLDKRLQEEGDGARISVVMDQDADRTVAQLNGQMVQNMSARTAVLDVQTNQAQYTLPAQQLNIETLMKQFGTEVSPSEVKIELQISKPEEQTIQLLELAVAQQGVSLAANPVDFTITASVGDRMNSITDFSRFVSRSIPMPLDFSNNQVSTAVVMDNDGLLRHVPTQITQVEGEMVAVIHSLTNSTYGLIWHSTEFEDMENHWAKESVEDLGGRLVTSGFEDQTYRPDQSVTRAEFTAMLVRALGMRLEREADSSFTDVTADRWYQDGIETAYQKGLVQGFEDETFRPGEPVTREQAMVMLNGAMKLTDLQIEVAAADAERMLAVFEDGKAVSDWAWQSVSNSLQAGVIAGRSKHELAPKAMVTRAEAAVMIRQLLSKANLI